MRPTVQGALEAALVHVLRHPVRLTAAGRTDAGVHADGQVVSLATPTSIPPAGLRRALDQWLPSDIWIVDATEAPESFDARRAAVRRWYRYAVWRHGSPAGQWHGRALLVPDPLDVSAMRRAAWQLVGRRDVAAFATRRQVSQSTVRTIFVADWLEIDPCLLIFEICADAFVTHMVRATVGGLLWVGTGRWTPEHFITSLDSADRRTAGPNAPALGLTLHRIEY